jgi:hypothetical protein
MPLQRTVAYRGVWGLGTHTMILPSGAGSLYPVDHGTVDYPSAVFTIWFTLKLGATSRTQTIQVADEGETVNGIPLFMFPPYEDATTVWTIYLLPA